MSFKKRRGSSEFLYLMMVLTLTIIIIAGFNNFSRNIIKLNETSKQISNNFIDIKNINVVVGDSIKNGNFEELKKIDDYEINIIKLTNNLQETKTKSIKKDYKKTNIIKLNKGEQSTLSKDVNKNYFLFSTSKNGISIGYDKDTIDYSVGEINNIFYYGIENKQLRNDFFVKSEEENSKLIYFEFENNSLDRDFFIAKIKKNEEMYYTLYTTTNSSIIEIYSFYDKGGM